MGKNLLFRYTKPTKMKGFQEKTAYLTENVCYVSSVWSMGLCMAVL